MIVLLPCSTRGKKKSVQAKARSKGCIGRSAGCVWASQIILFDGVWVLTGYRGLRNEARKVARAQLSENVDSHNKDFGFHSFSYREP